MLGGVGHHLGLVDDRPLRQIVDGPDVRRQESEAVEAAPIEPAVLVQERRQDGQLGVLDRAQLVSRARLDRG